MLRTPTCTAHFSPLPRSVRLNNPHIGFQSFQHYRGDRLFPDSVEGWEKEFLPDRTDIVRLPGEAYSYPDTNIAYFRLCWKDFEPEEGHFQYALIDQILEEAHAQGQTVLLRLMPHTTRPNQDVPAWLKAQIPTPDRPADQRVKDSPRDRRFFEAYARAVSAFGAHLDGDPRLEAIDISLCGAWGEGHQIDAFPAEWLHQVQDAYLRAFSRTPLVHQANDPSLVHRANAVRPVGVRFDCLGDMRYHMIDLYPRCLSQLSSVWEKAPVLFESCWTMAHWYEEERNLEYIIEQSLKWHISSFNAKSSTLPEAWRGSVEEWINRMGYRLALRFLDFPDEAAPGDQLHLSLWIENQGVAPLYHPACFTLRLKGERTSVDLPTALNPSAWLPGDSINAFEVTLPSNLPAGCYQLEAALLERGSPLALATDGEYDSDYLEIGSIDLIGG